MLSNNEMSNLIETDPTVLFQNPFLTGLVQRHLLKIQEEVLESPLPTFLASINFHRNLIFNEAGMKLLNSTPQQMLARSLPSLWVPPGELKPINYDKQIPPYLQEVLALLRQQSELPAHRYWGWKSNGDEQAEWGQWVADIKLRDLGGGHYARLMVDRDWIPAA